MKICVYTDVHSNLEALENLRKTDDYKSADLRIFLGDIVAVCPYPNECIKTLLESGDIWLMGNHDCYYAFGLPKEENPYFQGDKRKHQRYVKKTVKKEYKKVFMSLPKTFRLQFGDKRLLFVHYPWETDRLVMDDPDVFNGQTLNELFAGFDENYIIFGHEHKSVYCKTNKATYIGVNALGVSHPGRYVMIDVDKNHFSFEEKKIDYDLAGLRKKMLEIDYPWAKEYTTYIREV